MHGIDNFRFAKSLIFTDDTVRKILLKFGLLQNNKEYLRIGCSGARECSYHPGGEVYEVQLLNGKDACIQTHNTNNNITEIKGRVLKHMPTEAFRILQDATDIGLEKIFKLDNDETMYAVGTKYDRYEPEWTEFTGGRQYERRGHIHSMLVKEKNEISEKHEKK